MDAAWEEEGLQHVEVERFVINLAGDDDDSSECDSSDPSDDSDEERPEFEFLDVLQDEDMGVAPLDL